MPTPAEVIVLTLLLVGTKATDDAAVAASKRACTWALRHRWEDCVDFDDVIVFLLPRCFLSHKRKSQEVEEDVGTGGQTATKPLSGSFDS